MYLFFDFDGVLVDSMPYWETLGVNYLKRKGKIPEPGFREIIQPMTMEESALYVKQKYGMVGTVEEIIEDMMKQMNEEYLTTIPLKAGVKEAIKQWNEQGYSMAIITASEEEIVAKVLERFQLTDYFSFLLTCTSVHCSKREKRMYEIAKDWAGIAGTDEQAVLFDDNLTALKVAKEAGWLAVGMQDSSNYKEAKEIQKETGYYLETLLDFQ